MSKYLSLLPILLLTVSNANATTISKTTVTGIDTTAATSIDYHKAIAIDYQDYAEYILKGREHIKLGQYHG